MKKIVIRYYNKRFGEDINSAYIHLVREIGEIALAIEKQSSEHARLKITEAAALLEYMDSKYKFNLDSNIKLLYSRKMDTITRLSHKS
jgi:hypothetical protein